MRARFLLAIMGVIGLPVWAGVAQADTPKTDNYILTTNPPGATAYFYGDYNLVVNTPANLPSNLSGNYKVRITRPGYEAWKGELAFMPGSSHNVNINLSAKTRLKAGLRSLLIPGWGQYYSCNSARGAIFTVGIVGTAGILYYTDRRYQDKKAAYYVAYQNYINASSIDERNRLQLINESTRLNASKWETDRRRIFYFGLGLWVYNILDSILFFPEESAFYPTVTASEGGGAKVSFVVKF